MSEPKKSAGRPKLGHIQYKRNIPPEFKIEMDRCLERLKSNITKYIDRI